MAEISEGPVIRVLVLASIHDCSLFAQLRAFPRSGGPAVHTKIAASLALLTYLPGASVVGVQLISAKEVSMENSWSLRSGQTVCQDMSILARSFLYCE